MRLGTELRDATLRIAEPRQVLTTAQPTDYTLLRDSGAAVALDALATLGIVDEDGAAASGEYAATLGVTG